jgi:hypothetical protein
LVREYVALLIRLASSVCKRTSISWSGKGNRD